MRIVLDFQFVQLRADDGGELNQWLSNLLEKICCDGNSHEAIVCLNASLSADSLGVQSKLLADFPSVKEAPEVV